MIKHQIDDLSSDPIQHLDDELRTALARHENLSGCFTIIGPVKLCWKQSGSSFKVCLQLAGIDVTCVNIDPNNPCAKLEGNVVCAKASIEVCLKDNCLTYKAQACYKDFPCFGSWKCTNSSGKIICF
jgi:hypothetical protein